MLARNLILMPTLDIGSEWHCLDCENYPVDGRDEDLSIWSRPNVSSSIGHQQNQYEVCTCTYTYVGAGTAWARPRPCRTWHGWAGVF